MLEQYSVDKPDVITISLALSKNINLSHLQEAFIPRLLKHPRFSARLRTARSGYEYEAVSNFHATSPELLGHHIHFEQPFSEAEIFEERMRLFSSRLSEIMSTPLDMKRPLWKVFVFPRWSLKPDSHDTSTLVLRVHHSLADGIGLVKYFLSHVVDTKCDTARLLVPTKRLKRPRTLYQTITETLQDMHCIAVKPFFRDPPSILTRVAVSEPNVCTLLEPHAFTVRALKAAATRYSVTINDLIFASFAGALQRYLTECGDDTAQMRGMRVAMPFNRHMFDDFQMSDVSNQLVMLPVPIPVTEESRQSRLEVCHETMERLKRSIQPRLAEVALKIVAGMPGWLRKWMWARVASCASALMSNVAGPTERVSFGGVTVEGVWFSPPCDVHNAVNISMFSYDGTAFVSVAGDAERLKRPALLAQFFRDELDAFVAGGGK